MTDNWLQDFITDVPVPVSETGSGILDMEAVGTGNDNNTHIESISASTPIAASDDQPLPYYDPALLQSSPDTFDMDMTLLPMDMDTSTSPADTLPSISTPVSPAIDPNPNPPPPSSSFHPPPPPLLPISRRPYEYDYPLPETVGVDLDPYTPATCQCQCHENTLRELVRVNMTLCTASRSTPAGTIDAILTSQRGLQNLAETILQCTVCAGTRIALLTVVMVSIDSLISAIEGIAASSDEFFARYSSPKGMVNNTGQSGSGSGNTFKSQIEVCPLLVGSFRVPPEEKYPFVKQVLQTRLGGLLTTIRRIRFRAQEMLAGSAAKGRLIMMMETDRRLQVVMMRMRMSR